MDSGSGGHTDSPRQHVRAARHATYQGVARPGHEPRHHSQGQPSEHSGVGDAARQRRAGRRARAVSIVRPDNTTHSGGHNRRRWHCGRAFDAAARIRTNWWQFAFIVMAEKDGDVAYVGSDWNEGISPWEFGTGINLVESAPLLRGTVFTDRGVYRLGEEIHLKAILRHNAPSGIALLPAGTPVIITVRDSQNRVVDERTVRVNNWSSAEWTMTLPADGALGNYSLRALLESDRPRPAPANAPAWRGAGGIRG